MIHVLKSFFMVKCYFFEGAIAQSRLQKNVPAKIYITIMLVFFCIPAFSMQSPWNQKWKKIDTKTYRIIFPAGTEKLAQRVANLMEYYSPHLRKTIKTKARRIPIVLVNQYASANGFVSPAPFYSHWFSTPSSFDSLEWFHGLAIHEGRHMVQIDKMKDGAGKYTWRILGGANGTGALVGLYLPMWFLEGDAVVTETALTAGGRGRMPSFDMWHRALELSGKRYSYHRAYLGGYNDALPYADYYRLGYLLCSYVRKHYGADVWDRVLNRVGKYFLFQNFDSALKSETGKSIDSIYHNAMEDYYRLWKSQRRGLTMTEADIISPSGAGVWSSRFFPLQGENENVLSIRWSRDDAAALVRIKGDGSEEKLLQVPVSLVGSGFHNEKGMSAGGGKVLWRESVPDLRWGYRSYSDLILYDVASKKKKRITREGKFISSTISRDGKQAAGISYGPDLIYRLFVYDTSTGKKLKEVTLGTGTYYFDPAFGPRGKEILTATLASKGKGVAAISLDSGMVRNVIVPVDDENFRSPCSYNQYILYGSDYSGIDNIYALDTATGKRFQVTCRPLGAFSPSVSPDGKKILFSDYSVYGYRAAAMPFDPAEWKPLKDVERRALNYIDPVVKQEAGQRLDVDELVPKKQYKESGYSPALHSINFYGWIPIIDLSQVDLRLMVQSLDVMQTTAVNVSYIYNMNENTHGGEAGISYMGIYPVLNVYGGYGQRAVVLKAADNIADSEMMRWDEGYAVGDVILPLNLSRGIHYTYLNFSAGAGYVNVQSKTRSDYRIYGMANDGNLQFLSYGFSAIHYLQGNSIEVGPRWGQVFNGRYKHTPFYGSYRGAIVSTDLTLYFPGILKSHNISLAAGYEYQKPGDGDARYYFTSYFMYPRGYTMTSYENLVKGSFDYNLPVLNVNGPSWDIPYIKRILGTVFFDYGYARDRGREYNYRSTGIELLAELHILGNAFLSFAVGGRYSYCIDGNEHVVSLAFRSLIPDPYYRGKMRMGRGR